MVTIGLDENGVMVGGEGRGTANATTASAASSETSGGGDGGGSAKTRGGVTGKATGMCK